MMICPISKTMISHLLGVFALLLANVVPSLADDVDPTTPSSQITDLLTMHGGALAVPHNGENKDKSKSEDEPSIMRPVLRLKAIVMRDLDNGTAIISNNDIENYVISLQRSHLQDAAHAWSIGGISLIVKEFSELSVTMQTLDNTQQFIVN